MLRCYICALRVLQVCYLYVIVNERSQCFKQHETMYGFSFHFSMDGYQHFFQHFLMLQKLISDVTNVKF
jgi:hypothetical protein